MALLFRWSILVFLGMLLLLAGVFFSFDNPPSGDVALYRDAGKAILAGQVPYRDFQIEYPPGALLTLVLPALLENRWAGDYQYFFAGEMALFLVATMFLTVATSWRLNRPWLPPALAVTAGGLLLLYVDLANARYDAVVAFALSGAAWTTAARRYTLAWAFLGFGTLAKLTPIVATAALYPFRQGRLRGILVFVSILLAGFIPAFLASPAGFSYVFSYHADRGLQIESFAASILLKLDWVEGVGIRYGAWEVVGGLSEVMATMSLPITLSLLFLCGVIIWREAHRRRLGPDQFPRYAAALLLAFIIGSKVLSPQYLIWLLPLVPLACRGVWGVGVSALFLLTCWLTIPMISAIYGSLGRAHAAGIIDIQHIDIQRFRSIVVEESFYSVDPLNMLLVRNILLLILWLAILLAPAKERNGGV